MGLLDSLGGALKGVLGQVEADAVPALMSAVLAKTNLGDLQGLVNSCNRAVLAIRFNRGWATAPTCP